MSTTNPAREATREAQPSATPRTDKKALTIDSLIVVDEGNITDSVVPASFARTLETELQQANARERDLKDELAKRDAELAEMRRKADECWGAANYRLKYLDVVGRALGRPHVAGESDAGYANECASIATEQSAELARLKARSGEPTSSASSQPSF